MSDKPVISIIGPGRVGQTIGRLAHQAGWRIAAVAGSANPEKAKLFAQDIEAEFLESNAKAAQAGELLFLTVRDDAIESVCRQLEQVGALSHKPGVLHCSGALGSNALQAAADVGCPTASMHPLQTFPSVELALKKLPGTFWFIEGVPELTDIIQHLVTDLQGQPVLIDSAVKPLYHAAAVLGANYLITLLDLSITLLQQVGLDEAQARQAIAPLTQTSIQNALEHGTQEALTGPIARGDAKTVARHLDALAALNPQFEKLYRAVGQHTLALARQKGSADPMALDALQHILEGEHQ